MSPTRKTEIALFASLMVTFIAFSSWVVLRRESYSFQSLNTPTTQPTSTPTITPDTGFVLNIPQKALMKNYVTVSVKAPSGTKCELIYIPPSGNTHKTDTIADSSGLCIWKWKVEESEGKGNARLIFTIGDISETHFIQILSSF